MHKKALLTWILGFFLFAFCLLFSFNTQKACRPPSVSDIIWYSKTSKQNPNERNIFFHETSGAKVLNARQACAVESAAKMNPNTNVSALMTARDIDMENKLMRQLLSYGNVNIKHIDLKEYFQGTPLENLYNSGALNRSKWQVSHTSDVLRYLTLWKFGGTYLDLDVIVLRSLEGLENFAGAQSTTDIGAGALNFEWGHPFLPECIEDLRKNFKGDVWINNGPGVITRVLQSNCGVLEVPDMTVDKCGGFTVFPPYTFYPIDFYSWKSYFNETGSEETIANLTWSLTAHVWNKASFKETVKVGSKQPYSILAETLCPKVYANCGMFM